MQEFLKKSFKHIHLKISKMGFLSPNKYELVYKLFDINNCKYTPRNCKYNLTYLNNNNTFFHLMNSKTLIDRIHRIFHQIFSPMERSQVII